MCIWVSVVLLTKKNLEQNFKYLYRDKNKKEIMGTQSKMLSSIEVKTTKFLVLKR